MGYETEISVLGDTTDTADYLRILQKTGLYFRNRLLLHHCVTTELRRERTELLTESDVPHTTRPLQPVAGCGGWSN